VLNLAFIALLWKELLVGSFDPALATAMGFRSGLIHYLLMALVAVTAVASFEQVGSILVVAMLIVPASTAQLLSDRLRNVLWISVGIAAASAVLGHFAAVWLNTNTAGTMSVVVGLFYLAAVVLSPRYGILVTLARNLQTSLRIVGEDLLGMLYRLEELAVERPMQRGEALRAVGGGLAAGLALGVLLRRGRVRREGRGLRLTDSGRRRASQLVRSHRLWEAYLVEHLGLPLDHVHDPAMRMEHFIDRQLQERLADEVAQPTTDPHGREIPRST
jgi:manganese/zinc/iron transport system permease protein